MTDPMKCSLTNAQVGQLVEAFKNAYRALELQSAAQQNVINSGALHPDTMAKMVEDAKRNPLIQQKIEQKYKKLAVEFEIDLNAGLGLDTATQHLIQGIQSPP